MAQADGYLRIDTKLNNDEFQSGLKKLKSAGTTAALAAGAAIGAALFKGMDFESGMSKVQAISGATGEALDMLTEKAKEMGAKTVFSATESAEAFQYMAMAGWKTEEMLSGIEGVMNLAAASGENLGLVSDIVTDALTAFGLKASDSAHFADVLAAASSNSNTNVAMMGDTFKYVAPIAGALGYTIEDTALAIGLMANAGIKSSQAGTSLRAMLSRLSKPTKEVQTALNALGISLTDASGNIKPLNVLMQDLRNSFNKLDKAQKPTYAAMIAGQEAMSGLLAIVNASSTDFDKLTSSIAKADGTAEHMAETMTDNLKGQLTILSSAAEGLALSFYDGIDEPLKKAVKSGTKSIEELTESMESGKLKPAMEGVGNLLASLIDLLIDISTAVLPPLISILGILGSTIDVMIPTISAFLLVMAGMKAFQKYNAFLSSGAAVWKAYTLAVNANTAAETRGITISTLLMSQMTAKELLIGVLTGKISVLTAAKMLATKAQMALNAAWSANPVGVVITSVTIFAGILASVSQLIKKQTQEEIALAEAQKKNAESINERSKSYKEMQKRQNESVSASLSEIEYSKRLYKELSLLADENGKVDESNQARANFIIGELNGALGTEIALSNGIIQNYKSIQEEIYKTIEAKQFEILMQSQEEKYAEAIKNRASAEKELSDAYTAAAPALSQLNDITAKSAQARKDFAEAEKNDNMVEMERLRSLIEQYDKQYDAIYNKNAEVIKSYKTAQSNYKDITDDIISYENAMTIAQKEGKDAAIEYVESQMSGYLDLEAATKKHGENQQAIVGELGNTLQGSLLDLENAMRQHAEAPSEATLAALQTALERVEEASGEYQAAGGKIVDGLITGINGKKIDIGPLLNTISSKENELKKTGIYFDEGVAKGIREGEYAAVNAAVDVVEAAIKAAKGAEDAHSPAKIPEKEIGKPFDQGIAIGIEKNSDIVEDAAESVIKDAIDAGIKSSRVTTVLGETFVDGVKASIIDDKYELSDAVESIFDDLDLKHDIGILSDDEYYAEMEVLRDKHIKKGTKQWWDYTKKLISYEEKKAEDERKNKVDSFKKGNDEIIEQTERFYDVKEKLGIANEKDEAEMLRRQGNSYLEFLKQIEKADFLTNEERKEFVKEYTEKAQNSFIDAYTVIADSAKEKFDEIREEFEDTLSDIEKRRDTFNDKLNEHAPIYRTVTLVNANEGDESFVQLTDWKKAAEEINEYDNLLNSVIERGASDKIKSHLLSMGIEEGTKYAKALLNASDKDFKEYTEGYESYLTANESIAESKFQDEVNAASEAYKNSINGATDEILTELKEKFGDIPDDFLTFGDESGENFKIEFMKHFENIASDMQLALDGILSDFKFSVDDIVGNNVTNNETQYNFYGTNGSVSENLQAAKNNETLNRMRGIG